MLFFHLISRIDLTHDIDRSLEKQLLNQFPQIDLILRITEAALLFKFQNILNKY